MKIYPSRCKQHHFFNSTRKQRKLPTACSIEILPDEALIGILSCLTLTEAVQTSVLSHRWRHLWQFASGNFVCKLEQRNAGHRSFDSIIEQLVLGSWDFHCGPSIESTEFVNLVYKVMDLHQGPSIDKLMIHFGSLSYISPNPIYSCILFAMQKNVRVLELASIARDFPDLEAISRVMDPKSSFLSLRVFTLVNISIRDEVVEYILSSCPYLEQLSLKGGKDLRSLNVVSPSLKSLTIWTPGNLKRLTISAVNLVSFEYLGFPTVPSFEFMRFSTLLSSEFIEMRNTPFFTLDLWTDFCFQNAPNLSEITSDINYLKALVNKRDSLKPLKKLALRFYSRVILEPFYYSPTHRILPRLRSLKQLELEITVAPDASLLFWVFFVMACPSLSAFSVQFYEETSWDPWFPGTISTDLLRQRKRAQKELNSYRHKHLKLVKLMGVVGQMNYIEFALDLLNIAKSLEKLFINPKSDAHRTATVEDHARLLEANLPLGAELVIQ